MLLSAFLPFLAATVVVAAALRPDPIPVVYPRGDCQTGILEVEVFDRAKGAWGLHPRHPRILADGCHQEDAGGLLNEIRVRCVDPERPERAVSAWVVGAEVFSPGIAAVCEPGPPRIRLISPRAGEAVSDPSKLALVEGRVVLDPAGSQALVSLRVENLSQAAAGVRVDFSPDGRFQARVPLESGSNQVGIQARLSDGREASAEFKIDFDPSRLRDELLEAERQRMRRIRTQRGEVEIEAEAAPPRPRP